MPLGTTHRALRLCGSTVLHLYGQAKLRQPTNHNGHSKQSQAKPRQARSHQAWSRQAKPSQQATQPASNGQPPPASKVAN